MCACSPKTVTRFVHAAVDRDVKNVYRRSEQAFIQSPES